MPSSAHQPSPKSNHTAKKGRPPSPPAPEKGPRTPTSNQPQSPADKLKKTAEHQSSSKGKEDPLHRDKKKAPASGQIKDKDRAAGPVISTLPQLPLPQIVAENADKGDKYVTSFTLLSTCIVASMRLYLIVFVCLLSSIHSLKDGSLPGKKKLEKKTRQLLTDLPLPPELPCPSVSPSSPPDKLEKSQTFRRRPK